MCHVVCYVEHSVQNTADNKEVHVRQCFLWPFTRQWAILAAKRFYIEMKRNQDKKQFLGPSLYIFHPVFHSGLYCRAVYRFVKQSG